MTYYGKPDKVDLKCIATLARGKPWMGGFRLVGRVSLALRYTSPAAPLLGARGHKIWSGGGRSDLRNFYLLQWPRAVRHYGALRFKIGR